MNIFVLDEDVSKAAEQHCNKHIVKQILELGQLICTTRHILGDKTNIKYRKTHENHPIQKWLKKNPANYHWAISFSEALSREYTFRYNKNHATSLVIKECKDSFFAGNIPNFFPVQSKTPVYNEIDPPVLAMPDEYKFENDVIKSYRHYYALDKYYNIDFRFTKRKQPEWISEIQNENKKTV